MPSSASGWEHFGAFHYVSLSRLDSNQNKQFQRLPCYQLHHGKIGQLEL